MACFHAQQAAEKALKGFDASVGSLPSGMPGKATAEKALVHGKGIFTFCLDAVRQIEKNRLERSNDG